MVTFFPKPVISMLGCDAFFCIFLGNAIPGHQAADPVLGGSGDGNGYIAKLRKAAFEKSNGINGRKLGSVLQPTKDFGFECRFDPQANEAVDGPKQLSDKADRLPKLESLNGKDLILSHRGFPFAVKLEQGSWVNGGTAAESENGIIELKIK